MENLKTNGQATEADLIALMKVRNMLALVFRIVIFSIIISVVAIKGNVHFKKLVRKEEVNLSASI